MAAGWWFEVIPYDALCCGSEHGSRRLDDLPGAECSRREVRTGVRSDYLTRYGDRQLYDTATYLQGVTYEVDSAHWG